MKLHKPGNVINELMEISTRNPGFLVEMLQMSGELYGFDGKLDNYTDQKL